MTKADRNPPRAFSVAPMMEWTDRRCRRFHRMLTRRALLFTEMAVDRAVIHGARDRLIGFDHVERPIALQLGGSEHATLAEAARIGADFGYDEINLNVGCPSDRVQGGCFGAVLMREPERVAACVAAMGEAVEAPVTVKCRIGVDDQDPEKSLFGFVETVAAAGCRTFYVHARKAWLKGLSPKENRDVPPLDYALVRRLKAARPDLEIILNGGLASLAQARAESAGLDGVMLGRAAYQTPWMLADVDRAWFDDDARAPDRDAVVRQLIAYADDLARDGVPVHTLTRHILGLFHGVPGARAWRRTLSEEAVRPGAGPEVIARAWEAVRGRAAA